MTASIWLRNVAKCAVSAVAMTDDGEGEGAAADAGAVLAVEAAAGAAAVPASVDGSTATEVRCC